MQVGCDIGFFLEGIIMKGKIKNTMIKASAVLSGLLLIVAACAVDSDSYIPLGIAAVCTAWLLLLAYANA